MSLSLFMVYHPANSENKFPIRLSKLPPVEGLVAQIQFFNTIFQQNALKLLHQLLLGVIKYRAERQICQGCEYLSKCVRSPKNGRVVSRKIGIDYRHWVYSCFSKEKRLHLLRRRKHKIEGCFADATNNHGFKRMRFRGIEKATIQNLMIAAIQNLRKLIKVKPLKSAASVAKTALYKAKCAVLSRLFCYRTALIANLSEYSIIKELFQLFRFKLIFFKNLS